MLREHLGRIGDEEDVFKCRRLFSDDYFWLTVDLDENREVETFHLSYAFGTPAMSCYRWRRDQGLSHYWVEDGGDLPLRQASPLLLERKETCREEVIDKFKEASVEIDQSMAIFILQILGGEKPSYRLIS